MRYGKDGEDRYHEDRYPESKFKIGDRVICHSDKCYRKIEKRIKIEKQQNYKTSVLTIEEIFYSDKKYRYKVSHFADIFEENDLTKYKPTSKTILNLDDDVWDYENSDPNRKEFIVFAHGSECFQEIANNDSVIKELSTEYSEHLQNYFIQSPEPDLTITKYLMSEKVFNINFPSISNNNFSMNYEMIFDALVYITFGCQIQNFFAKRFLCNNKFQTNRNWVAIQKDDFNWEKHLRVLNFFPKTFKMHTIYSAFQGDFSGKFHEIKRKIMNKKNYLELSKIYKKLKENLPKDITNINSNDREKWLSLVKKIIDKENKLDEKVKHQLLWNTSFDNFLAEKLNTFTEVFLEQTKNLTISDQEEEWESYLFGVHTKAIPIIKKLRTLPFKLLRDVPLLPNETVIIRCAPGCTLMRVMGLKRVKLLKKAKNLKEFLSIYNKFKKKDMCMFKGSVPNLNLTFFQNEGITNVGGFGLYELPLSDKWCLNKTSQVFGRCPGSPNDDKLYWQTENSYLDKNKPGAKSDITEVIKKIREKYKKNSEIILYINSCRSMQLCELEKDEKIGWKVVKRSKW